MSVRTRLSENLPLALGTLGILCVGLVKRSSPVDIAVAWALGVLLSLAVDWILEPMEGSP